MRSALVLLLSLLVTTSFTRSIGRKGKSGGKSPIILGMIENMIEKKNRFQPGFKNFSVPGDGGSQIFAKINKTWVPHYLCRKYSDVYYDLWLNIEELAPVVIDCFVENMRLIFHFTQQPPKLSNLQDASQVCFVNLTELKI